MKYTHERMQEKVQEMKGSGGVPAPASEPSMDNLRDLASHALESGNMDEAESYANRIIEADPLDYRTWVVKGQAAGWQSSLRNIRILEAANCFAKAVELAPDVERESVENHISDQISRIASAIIDTRASIYIEFPSPDQAEPFEQDIHQIIEAVKSLLGRSGTRVKGIWEGIATQINNAVVRAWTEVIQPDFKNDPHPNDYDLQLFLDRLSAAENLTKLSIGLSDDDDVDDVVRYRNLILYAENRRDAKSFDWTVNGYVVSKTLSDKAKAVNSRLIREWRDKIAEIESLEMQRKKDSEKREAQRRFDEYWSTRTEEWQGLEHEQDKLQKELAVLQARAEDYPGRDEIPGLTQQLMDLQTSLDATSRLKRTERKELQSQIAVLEGRHAEILEGKLAAEQSVASERTKVEKRLEAVRTELTQPR